jgi:hypothetical protein
MTSPSRTGRRVMRPPPQQTHQTPIATSHGHARGVVRGPLHLPMARRCHTMPVSVAPLIACPPSRLPMAQGPLPMLRCCDAATLACERWTSRGTHPHPHPISLPYRFLSYRFCGVQPSHHNRIRNRNTTHTPTPTPTPHPHHTRTRSHTRPFLFFSRPLLPLSVSAYPPPPIIPPQCCPRYPSIAVTASACSLPWCRGPLPRTLHSMRN